MDFYNDTMSESLGDRYLESWDKRSTIRTLAKRVLSNPDQQLFFPKHEQPICSHPLITSLGIKVQKQILTQTAYKFMLGISEHETRVVTTAIQRSICGNMSLPHTLRQALQTVIIDESYHAMVAFDFIQQVQAVTGEEALSFPKDSDLGSAVALTLENLPTSMHDSFTMIAVCIAENLITQELIAQQPDPDVNPFFYEINRDHLADEGRHAKLFTEVVNFVWSGLLQVERQRIADELPAFIERWMKRKVSAECDRVILRSLSLTEDEVEKVIDDTHPDLDFKCAAEINPHIMHIQKWLRRVGVWQSQKNLWDLSPIERIPNHDSHDALVPSAADTSDGIISSTTVCRLLSAAISKDPLHLAIRAHNHLTTYEDLNRHLSALSFTLVKAGLTSGCRVGIYVKDRFDYVCTLLGIMKAGLTAVPLPIDGPSAYLENILEQADLSLIICDEVARNLFDLLSFDKPTWLCSKSLFIGEALVEDLSQPEGAACILFTSGTTGKPKGVVLLHNAIAEFGTGAKASFPLRSDDVILQFSNLSFDASLAEIVNTIAAGATLAIPSQGIINSSADFFQECADLGVTVLNLPAAYWAQLIHEKLELPQTIKIVLVYGESLNFSSLTKWYQTTKKAVLINTYGPTEASIGTSFCHLDKHEHLRSKHQLIGTNFPGKTIHVLDQLERPVPFGAIGEICVAGIGVNAFYISGRGNAPIPVFHNNPQLGRLYRTGDYGQWVLCPDTNKLLLVFHGRKDRQVKISGSRVELEQVENILKMHSEVEDALVLVRDQMNVATLAAFVVKKSGHDVSEFELSELLEKSLPKHCRPSTIHVIDQWPLTLRGKVDKNALLESLGSSIVEDSDSLTVSDELAKIWQNLLATPTIERDSHFFKLGGHSLLAMALVGQVNDRWQAGLTLRQVIESPNFAAMARCIQKSIECKNKVQVRKIPLNQDRGPLNYAQDALLLIDRVGSGNSIEYNVAFSIPIRSDVDDQAIKLAINHVLKRHRALRTVFSWEGGKPSQTIVPVNIDLRRERVSFADFEEITKDDARKPFRLSETPPLRIRFFEITDRSELLLYFNLHHIIHDGFSIRILLEEIFKTYHAIQSGQKELLPDFRASYLDFSFAIRQKVENERDILLSFWQKYLHNAKPLTLPIRRKERGDPHDGSSNSIVLESFHLKKLRQQCLTERVGFFAVLFSGAMFALRQISSEEDVTVGSVMSIRDDQEYMGLVGIFVNTVLLRNSAPHEATTMREYFRQEHNSIVDVMSFRHAPLTMLINEQCLPRDATEHKVFDVMVNYHPFGTLFEPADSDLFNGKVQFVDNKTTTVGLGIDLYDWGSSLQIRLGYCRNLYDSDDIANLAKNIRDLLIKVSQLDWSIDYRILSTPATEG